MTRFFYLIRNFLIGWLVSQALGGLIIFNDAAHLPPELCWTGFPASLKPPGP